MSERPTTLEVQCPACGAALPEESVSQCAKCGAALVPDQGNGVALEFLDMPEMRYQNAYVWLILVASLDVVLTMLVLFVWRGHEVNPIAATVIETMGFGWAIALKYALIVLVILICESVGRRDDRVGRGLSVVAIMLNIVPVVYTFGMLMIAEPAVTI